MLVYDAGLVYSASSDSKADLRVLTSAGAASDSAGLKAAMVGLVPTIHDGGQMRERRVMSRLMRS